jgi:hypothetical protein
MTNLRPDPRPSPLGFDELVGVVVAFTVIGTIFMGVLRQKDTGFSLGGLTQPLTTAPASPSVTASPIVGDRLPATPQPNSTAVNQAIPQGAIAPATPTQTTPVASAKVSQAIPPVVAVPPVAASGTPAKKRPSTAAKALNFPDVPQVYWARPYIEALAARGIVAGFREDGTFRPNQPVTRAQFAAQLQKAFDQKVVVSAPNYKDVPNKFWASSAIQETTRTGFLRGYPGNEFRPNQPIPKVQALSALSKGLGLTPGSDPKQVLKTYQDANQVPNYATNIIAAATEAGLVVNYPNRQRLEPNKILTRAEAAALTYQGMVQAGKAPAITSEYVAQPK